jgi:2-polyprenyl-3-methyl-5-hydroxy-6-metoxy-1,4-benzoquinol methylase
MVHLFYGRIIAMDKFLPHNDELGLLIQRQASELYQQLVKLDASELGLPDHCLYYYNASHSKRLFFSIETSAHLLYRSVKITGKQLPDLVIMDYGAGVGTLYLLAKLIGFKKVIYNDHLDDWRLSAQLIAEAIGIKIDAYVVGDIKDCLDRLDEMNAQCDIVTSRNVIEHIYKLDVFYKAIHERQPKAIVFSSTTANKNNPASVLKHSLWHKKWEKVYRGKREVIIERQAPGLLPEKKHALAFATRGLAVDDLHEAIEKYRMNHSLPDPKVHGSNTCDPENGVWAEHLLGSKEYRKLINEQFFTVSFAPGFWDTHYSKAYMNVIGKLLNKIIAGGGSAALKTAPFIYVIAVPK